MTTDKRPKSDLFGQKSQMDFKYLAGKIKSNWYWFVFSIGTCLLISFLYLRYAVPLYKTSTKIYISNDTKASAGDDALATALGGQYNTSSNVEGEAEILKTRNIMENVVKDLNLYITYYDKGQFKSVDLYKNTPFTLRLLESPDDIKPVTLNLKLQGNKIHVFNDNFNKLVDVYEQFIIPGVGKVQLEKGLRKANASNDYVIQISSLKQTITAYLNRLSVSQLVKNVGILVLDYTYEVPDKSADVLNKLIASYIQGNIVDKNKIADSTIAFIQNRLVLVGSELGSIEGNVQTFKQQNKLTDLAVQSSALVASTTSNVDELAKVETQISILNSIESYVTEANKNDRIVPNGALLADPGFAGLVERYNVIVLEKERSSISRTQDNPYMLNLDKQIASAKADMLSSLRGLKKSLQISENKIQSRSNIIEGEVKNVPAVERKFLDLTRQQQIKQSLYVFLLQKREETAISKTSNISNCKIIESPITFGAISPNHMSVLGYGFVLGAFLPFGIIFLKDRLNDRVISKEQVKMLTQAPIVGEIGNSNLDNNGPIAVLQGSRTAISEQFRSLRTNLSFFLKEEEKTILLTSSMGGEGKSFISLNLASVLALSGKKVVVMELDLRKPTLSSKLKLSNDCGFTNYVVSKDMLPEAIIKPSQVHENLFVIGSGIIPPNPAEIILNGRVSTLMKYLVENFDFIIIDAPPIGVVTDAQLLSKYADMSIYLVRQGFTFKDQLDIVQDLYLDGKMGNISILMNDVVNNDRYGSGYGYYEEATENTGIVDRLSRKFKKS